MTLTSWTSALSSSTSSLFSPSISSVVWYRASRFETCSSSCGTRDDATLASSRSFMRTTMSARASSLWLHTLAISSFAATFSASRRRIAALILSTSWTDGPAATVETEIMSCARLRGDEGGLSSTPFSRSAVGGDGIRDGSPEGGSKGENGVGGGPGSTGEAMLSRAGGWLERRRIGDRTSAGLSGMLPEVGVRLGLPGTGRPVKSEPNVRDTDGNGESGRLWWPLDVAPATSSTHCRRSASTGSSLLDGRRVPFSRSARACSRASSVALDEALRAASWSRQASSSCRTVPSAGWASDSSSSRCLRRDSPRREPSCAFPTRGAVPRPSPSRGWKPLQAGRTRCPASSPWPKHIATAASQSAEAS
ncbi:Recognition complex subunit 1 [Tolypocladium capitatum]|uniref:Recognition complex subunit 1 n=1 Tax=Tolypocladium capitatum TaxID=45235 RepID=A0A2K3Q756_9HYPO|nr:Recognition complex subunit 1 [Tolypocladium capitatum]